MLRKTSFVLVGLLAAMVAPSAALADGVVAPITAHSQIDCVLGSLGTRSIGTVAIKRTDDRVTAMVKLRGAPANARWMIEFNQTPLMGCYNYVILPNGRSAEITTNAQGYGTAVVSIPYVPGNTGAFVELRWLNEAAKALDIVASPSVDLS